MCVYDDRKKGLKKIIREVEKKPPLYLSDTEGAGGGVYPLSAKKFVVTKSAKKSACHCSHKFAFL